MVQNSTGMLVVVFIDFSKASDKVVWEKMWSCLQSMGMSGKFLRFLQALYQGSVCRVKVDGQVSEDFEVNTGLRQGCVPSPLLFSLYINGVTKRLQEEKCGVEHGEEKVPGLLFADGTCLLAPDESGLKKSLDVLVEWCKEWGVKINVAKCGIMHIHKKNILARCEVKYEVYGEAILMVSSYYNARILCLFVRELLRQFTHDRRQTLQSSSAVPVESPKGVGILCWAFLLEFEQNRTICPPPAVLERRHFHDTLWTNTPVGRVIQLVLL